MPSVDPSNSVLPIASHLPLVGSITAQASRLLYDRRMKALWQRLLLPASERLSVTPVNGPRKARMYQLDLDCEYGTLSLALQPADDGLMSMAAADDLGDALRALAAEALLGEMAEMLRPALPSVRVCALRTMAPSEAPSTGWSAVHRGTGEFARICVLAMSDQLHDSLRAQVRGDEPAPGAWRETMRLTGSATVASRPLAIALLRTLQVGDVVLLPNADGALEGSPATLRLGPPNGRRPTVVCRVQGDSLIVEGEIEMLDDEQDPQGDAEADSLGELELPVRFEVETVSVPLAQLEAIEPGYVIELGMPASDARLRLVSCGQVIGHAELVAVAGRLGARITRMVAQDESNLDE